MSGDGKRSVAEWPKLPRPSSTLPASPGAPLEVYGSDSSSNKIFTVVSTAGTTAMAIGSSTVAVGGTSTMTYNNDIVSTGSEIDLYAGTTKVFQIGAGDGNDVSLDTNGGNFYFGANHSHSGYFFNQNSTVLERIDSSGHVGIGSAPRRRGSLVEEDSTQRVVD